MELKSFYDAPTAKLMTLCASREMFTNGPRMYTYFEIGVEILQFFSKSQTFAFLITLVPYDESRREIDIS